VQPIEILVVEDNPGDAKLTAEALRDARILNRIHAVDNGADALAFLRREGKYGDAPRPTLVFLDLNLPKVSGHEVLATMKADEHLRSIPVVVMSSSDNEAEVNRAYDEQVSSYIVKPLDLNQYFAAIRAVKELWFHVVALPTSPEQ
jgi:chemotaxis family two-component system response regulator Rcp1